MNRDEARNILLLYRPGTADEDDPQVIEALAFARHDAELAQWLESHIARQKSLRAKFQEISVPEGLKEQIISEQLAANRRTSKRRKVLAMASAVVTILILAALWIASRPPEDDTLAIFRSRMVSGALRGYSMDLVTNNPAAVRDFLAQKKAPADYVLPESLQQTKVAGCAVQRWHGAKVSMICFRTGKPLPPGQQSDMWLFVVDRDSVKKAPETAAAELAPVNRLITAVWSQNGKLYLLGTAGDEQTIRKYL